MAFWRLAGDLVVRARAALTGLRGRGSSTDDCVVGGGVGCKSSVYQWFDGDRVVRERLGIAASSRVSGRVVRGFLSCCIVVAFDKRNGPS